MIYEKGKNHREREVVVAGVIVQASPAVPPRGTGGGEGVWSRRGYYQQGARFRR